MGGTVSGSFIPGPNVGVGIGGYLEGSYTFMTDLINVKEFEESEIFDEFVNDFGIDRSTLLNMVESLYDRAKELKEQSQPTRLKGLDDLLKEKNIVSNDATLLRSRDVLNKNEDDR